MELSSEYQSTSMSRSQSNTWDKGKSQSQALIMGFSSSDTHLVLPSFQFSHYTWTKRLKCLFSCTCLPLNFTSVLLHSDAGFEKGIPQAYQSLVLPFGTISCFNLRSKVVCRFVIYVNHPATEVHMSRQVPSMFHLACVRSQTCSYAYGLPLTRAT